MKNKFTLLLIALVTCFAINEAYSQLPQPPTWIPLDTVGNVVISYYADNCNGNDALTLQMINNGTNAVTVSWSFWGDGIFREAELNAEETRTGECSSTPAGQLEEYIPGGMTVADMAPIINVY